MPKPEKGESEKDFLHRCIPQLIKEEGYKQRQSVAICYNIYRREGTETKSPKPEKKEYGYNKKNRNKWTKEDKARVYCFLCDY